MLSGVVLAIGEMVVVCLFIGERMKTVIANIGCAIVFGPVPQEAREVANVSVVLFGWIFFMFQQ